MPYTGSSYERPPSLWAGAAPLGGDVYWRPGVSDDGSTAVIGAILVWHWCPDTEDGRWLCAGVRGHTLVSSSPLHLEPSLLWPCCGKHGWIRAGVWADA